jgi:hypothetical protein
MSGKIFVEAEAGPVMRTALDVLDFGAEVLTLLPEWNEREKRELLDRMRALHEIALKHLTSRAVRTHASQPHDTAKD